MIQGNYYLIGQHRKKMESCTEKEFNNTNKSEYQNGDIFFMSTELSIPSTFKEVKTINDKEQ